MIRSPYLKKFVIARFCFYYSSFWFRFISGKMLSFFSFSHFILDLKKSFQSFRKFLSLNIDYVGIYN